MKGNDTIFVVVKIDRGEWIVHFSPVSSIVSISKQKKYVTVLWTKSICKELLIHRFNGKIEIISSAIVCNAVHLDTVPKSFEFAYCVLSMLHS